MLFTSHYSPRLIVHSCFCLIVPAVALLSSMPVVSGQNSRQPGGMKVTASEGALRLQAAQGEVMSGIRLRLNLSDGSSVTGTLEADGQEQGTDPAGAYDRMLYRFKVATGSRVALPGTRLELRRYKNPEVLVALLHYDGPALASRNGVQLLMRLEGFARGLALKRFKLYWTAPVFTSDYRFLPEAGQLLLWQQMQGRDYHLLVPLAGDGMISDCGVSEIDFRYEFRVAASSHDPKFAPRLVPLFAYSSGPDPYRLPRESYTAAFTASNQYGRLRREKEFPEVFRWLGWCSWNTYYQGVSEEKILSSARSLRQQQIPVGMMLIDDGWLSVADNRLTDYDADKKKFPRGLAGVAQTLRRDFGIRHVGVWHTFQGYWDGVAADSEPGRTHKLFTGRSGKSLPEPRDGAGQSFYADWYERLNRWGIDFIKVDNQSSNGKFTDGLMPLFTSGGGTQRNLQEGARPYLSDRRSAPDKAALNVINCMEMSLENAFNWRYSNVARNSDDYLPDNPQNVREHIYQNAYNAYWTANFAWPDWDMFQSHDPHAEFHAIARAISGGPVYFTDEPGREKPELLRRLISDDGQVLRIDEPGMVTRDLLLRDPALEAVALEVSGRITRPGLTAGMVVAFNVNKSAAQVTGTLSADDVTGLTEQTASQIRLAFYQRSRHRAGLLDGAQPGFAYSLDSLKADLFTLVAIERGVAVFGLLDKYLGPAEIIAQSWQGSELVIRLRDAGEFGAWLEQAPRSVVVDGKRVSNQAFSYADNLLRIQRSAFAARNEEHEIRLGIR